MVLVPSALGSCAKISNTNAHAWGTLHSEQSPQLPLPWVDPMLGSDWCTHSPQYPGPSPLQPYPLHPSQPRGPVQMVANCVACWGAMSSSSDWAIDPGSTFPWTRDVMLPSPNSAGQAWARAPRRSQLLGSESANKGNHNGKNKRVTTDSLVLLPVVTQAWGLTVIRQQGPKYTRSWAPGPTLAYAHSPGVCGEAQMVTNEPHKGPVAEPARTQRVTSQT